MRTSLMRPAVRLAMVVGSLTSLSACEWFTDFKRQPSVVTWEQLDSAGVRGSPQYSVPINGTAMPAFEVSYSMPLTNTEPKPVMVPDAMVSDPAADVPDAMPELLPPHATSAAAQSGATRAIPVAKGRRRTNW